MSLRIIKNGLLDTIQDGGRYGYQHLGINPGGVMDRIGMYAANVLAGNKPAEPVVEMHFPAAEILFEENSLIALAGADFSAVIDGRDIPSLHPVLVKKGSILQFRKRQTGARIYLSVHGGFVIDQWLQNYSTNLQAKVGGFEGRSLKKNDRLSFKRNATYTFTDTQSECEIFPWAPKVSGLYIPDTIRFIHGAEYHLLDNRSQQELQSGMFKISSESNRMGYRLKGNGLSLQTSHELISTAVTLGTIQLLPGGQMIVLMADHQTTGGYPRVGHVISADISSLAQMQPGEEFHFQQTDIYTAEKLITAQEMNLQQLQNACNFRLHAHINQRR